MEEAEALWRRGSPSGWLRHSKAATWSLGMWWRRSLPRYIGLELLIYIVLYYSLQLVYRGLLEEDQRAQFADIVKYFNENLTPLARDLAFLLGFYVKVVVGRWWGQFRTLPWPDSMAMQLNGLVLPDQAEAATAFIHTFMRYVIAAYVICLRRLSTVVRNQFPTDDALVEAKLLTEAELGRLQMEGDVENVWWVPLTWSMTLTKNAKNVQKIIPSDHKELLRSLVRFKDGMEGVMGYDHIQVPPVYKQVVVVATYFYFGLSLIGSQELDTDNAQMFFPIILVLKFIFFIGWLKVADAIAHPFGEDDDDFQIGEMISRHIWASGRILSQFEGPPGVALHREMQEFKLSHY